jgi:2-ketoarginine methyltransferase
MMPDTGETPAKVLAATRGFFVAQILFKCVSLDLFAALEEQGGDLKLLCENRGWRIPVLRAVCEFLECEGFVARHAPEIYKPTPQGMSVGKYRGYFDLFIGGYGRTVTQLDRFLTDGPDESAREFEFVAKGSGELADLDALPLVKDLFSQLKWTPRSILDLGCGDAGFLSAIVNLRPDSTGLGIDPSLESISAANRLVTQHGLQDRILLVQASATRFDIPGNIDCVIFAFVLQEIIGQRGPDAVISLLKETRRRAPAARILVVEEEPRVPDRMVGDDPYATGYYNPYYLLQTLTRQQLLKRNEWYELFLASDYVVEGERTGSALIGAYCAQFAAILSAKD